MKNYQICFIRHGITAGNLEGRYIGATDLPLCDEGWSAVNRCVEAKLYPPVGRVYSAPLKRCTETAELIYPGREIIPVPDLRECDFGGFEGKKREELADLPEYADWLKGGSEARAPGGESLSEFTLRCVSGLNGVFTEMTRLDVGRAAIITHAGVITNLLSGFGLPKGKPADFLSKQGEGWLISMNAYLWQKGNVFEIVGKLTPEEYDDG